MAMCTCVKLEINGVNIPVQLVSIDQSWNEPTSITLEMVDEMRIGLDKLRNAYQDIESAKSQTIDRVVFNDPATVVIWKDGTKTIVKCQPGDTYNKETGLAMCIAKKFLGNKGNFNEVFKMFIEDYDPRV